MKITRTAVASLTASSLVAAQNQCQRYVLLSARGTNEPQGPSVGFVDMIKTTLSAVSGGIEYDVVYPASEALTANLGSEDINRYINAGLTACPQQQYALLGYSQGASALNIGLGNFTRTNNTLAYRAIKAVVVIGNPGHVAGANANVDQFGGDTTRDYTGSYYLNGFGAIPDAYYTDEKVLDICFQGDSVCAPTYPNASFVPYHLLYGTTPNVQSMGAQFLVSKLGGHAGNVTLSSPHTSTTQPSTTMSGTSTTSAPTTAFTGAAGALGVNVVLTVIFVSVLTLQSAAF